MKDHAHVKQSQRGIQHAKRGEGSQEQITRGSCSEVKDFDFKSSRNSLRTCKTIRLLPCGEWFGGGRWEVKGPTWLFIAAVQER